MSKTSFLEVMAFCYFILLFAAVIALLIESWLTLGLGIMVTLVVACVKLLDVAH